MVKLVSAKCPNCGAALKLSKEEEKTKCDYCHNTIIVDDAITPYSYVNISNYSDIHWDLDEIINEWQLTVVSNQVETGSFKYIVVNPIS